MFIKQATSAVERHSESNGVQQQNLYTKRGALNPRYIKRIDDVIGNCLDNFKRIFAVRVDLHLPSDFNFKDTAVVSRFMSSLQAQLDWLAIEKKKHGIRVHSHRFGYLWCREIGKESGKPHYHVYLIFNGNAFNQLGCYDLRIDSMFSRIVGAWASALRLSAEEVSTLVHIPENPTVQIAKSDRAFDLKMSQLRYRASYLAKYDTKHINARQRSFGCSRMW